MLRGLHTAVIILLKQLTAWLEREIYLNKKRRFDIILTPIQKKLQSWSFFNGWHDINPPHSEKATVFHLTTSLGVALVTV